MGSWSNCLIFLFIHIGLIFSFHYWFRDLLRELAKKYEVLLMVLFLVFFLFLASEGLLFVSFFWASFHSLSSPNLGSWVYQLMIQFIVLYSFFLQDYISFIFWLVFFFVVFSFGVVVFLSKLNI